MSSSGRSSLFRDHQFHHNSHNFNHNQSFSSTLLEEIYRSFDNDDRREIQIPRGDGYKTMKKSSSSCLERENRYVINQWMENDKINNISNSNKTNLRRAAAQSDGNSIPRRSDHRRPMNHSSSTSSSDSSSGIGGFSSSDTESMYGSYSSKPKSRQQQPQPLLKPIRTTLSAAAEFRRESNYSGEAPAAGKKSNSKKEGNLQRRALKIYEDLKKVKQPISPGGKLATFLNSLFNAGASKKHHKFSSSSTASTPSISSNGHKLARESSVAPTPSTATAAASRSCLSKTPSSAGRFERRSVRFVDDEQLGHRRNGGGGCGGADVAKRDSSSLLANDEQFKFQLREKHRKVEEAAKELLKNYHNKKELIVNFVANDHKQPGRNRKFNNDVHIRGFVVEDDDEDEDEDEDDESCCSSDLFELENLLDGCGGGGVDGRYREELPVYETTHVGTNRAIANGYIL